MILNYGLVEELFYARRYDQAIEEAHKVEEVFSDPIRRYSFGRLIALSYEMKGDSQHALPELQEMVRLLRLRDSPALPNYLADLAIADAVFGNRPEALRLLAEMTDMAKHRHVAPIAFAHVYAGLGDKDQTFEWLDKAFDDFPESVLFLKIDPRFDLLHSDPRFREFLQRLGLALVPKRETTS